MVHRVARSRKEDHRRRTVYHLCQRLGRQNQEGSVGAGPADRWISGGTLAEGGIRAPFAATRERLARLEAEAKDVAERRDQDCALRLALQGLEDFAERVQAGLTGASWQERREIIRALLKQVEVGRDEIRVVYRVSPPPFVSAPSGGTGALLNIVGNALNRPCQTCPVAW